jgi:hypothetical protein
MTLRSILTANKTPQFPLALPGRLAGWQKPSFAVEGFLAATR